MLSTLRGVFQAGLESGSEDPESGSATREAPERTVESVLQPSLDYQPDSASRHVDASVSQPDNAEEGSCRESSPSRTASSQRAPPIRQDLTTDSPSEEDTGQGQQALQSSGRAVSLFARVFRRSTSVASEPSQDPEQGITPHTPLLCGGFTEGTDDGAARGEQSPQPSGAGSGPSQSGRAQCSLGPCEGPAGGGDSPSSRGSPSSQVVCLICLEPLTEADFESGEAVQLECKCRGQAAMRHLSCALRWVKVKGDLVCDICKSEIKNLPAPTPPPSERAGSDAEPDEHPFLADDEDLEHQPLDFFYECLKVAWVTMILSVLFFDFSFDESLWIGFGAGAAYMVTCKLCICVRRTAMSQALRRTIRRHRVRQ